MVDKLHSLFSEQAKRVEELPKVMLRLAQQLSNIKKSWSKILFLFIIAVAIFFRFYGTPLRYVFDFDPTRDALISIHAENSFEFPLSGPKSGIAPFTFGPWYYYQIIAFTILTPFDYAPWIYIGITSVVTVIIFYFIGVILEDKKLGLILALLVALSPAELGPITGLSNPNLIPIQSVLTLLFFVLFIKRKLSWWWIVVWGFVIGVGINNHYQAIGLLVLPAIGLLYKRKNFFLNGILLFVGLVTSFIPMIIFNLMTDWHTARGYLEFRAQQQALMQTRWLFFVRDFLINFWSYVLGIPRMFGLFLLLYSAAISLYLIIKKKVQPIYILFGIAFMLNLILIRYSLSIWENYYFIYLHGFIFVFFSWIIWNSLKHPFLKFVAPVLVIGMFIPILKEDIRRLSPEKIVLRIHGYVEVLESDYPHEKIALYRCGDRSKPTAQAMAFLLHNDKKLDTKGVKVGIPSDDCEYPDLKEHVLFDKEWGYVILEEDLDPDAQKYWTLVTPEEVYRTNLEWWKEE
jgi:hypothetical protein